MPERGSTTTESTFADIKDGESFGQELKLKVAELDGKEDGGRRLENIGTVYPVYIPVEKSELFELFLTEQGIVFESEDPYVFPEAKHYTRVMMPTRKNAIPECLYRINF